MKKDEVKIGQVYTAKVTNRLVPVRIDSAHSKQGWSATNTATGKRIRIKSAQRLRGPAEVPEAEAREAVAAAVANDTKAADVAKAPMEKPTAKADAKPKRVSALDAAAQVLEKAGKPMNCKAMIAAMAEQGLWSSPAGKTPHATLYAAILREIGKKGDQARFKRVERGQFAFSG